MKIGLVTIGQAPRTDVVPEMRALLGPVVEVLEAGALDGMTPEEIAMLRPHEGDYRCSGLLLETYAACWRSNLLSSQ